MGKSLTAAEAAQVAGVSERTIRNWIACGALKAGKADVTGPKRWAIDVGDLGRRPGVRIDREALAAIETRDARSAGGILARLTTLELEVQALRARLREVEVSGAIPSRILPQEPVPARIPVRLDAGGQHASEASGGHVVRPAAAKPLETSFNGEQGYSDAGERFAHHAGAARWLVRHGVNSEYTPRSWAGWRQTPLDMRSVLNKALTQCDLSNWRITWRLHRCGEASCVCVEVLPQG